MHLQEAVQTTGGPGRLPDCPVCGQNAWSDPWYGTRLRGCDSCRTVLNDRSASRRQEEQRYEAYSTGPPADAAAIGESQWRWLKRKLLREERWQPPAVLDVGCGHGAFLIAARGDGCRVAGIELDPAAVATCSHAGLPVVRGSIFDHGLPPGPWDIITLWDVLEHLEYPADALRNAAAALRPGGVVVVRGRNAAVHARWKMLEAGCRVGALRVRLPGAACVHRWGFGPLQYRRLLQKAGFGGIRLYPGLPTPGDRAALIASRWAGQKVKWLLGVAGMGLYTGSWHRLYPFPSVLILGRLPAREG